MRFAVCSLPPLVIPLGTSTSNALADVGDAYAITIYSPATLTASQATVEVAYTSGGTDFVTLQSGGVDVTLPAGKATVISPPSFKQIRITSTSIEAQIDTFPMTSHFAV